MKRDNISWISSGFLIMELSMCLIQDSSIYRDEYRVGYGKSSVSQSLECTMLLRDVYAPEGGRATSPAYPYEKNGTTFHDITSCELRRRESSIAYSGVLRRMTDSSYLRTAASHCASHDPVPPRFHLQKRERKKSICAENMALSLE